MDPDRWNRPYLGRTVEQHDRSQHVGFDTDLRPEGRTEGCTLLARAKELCPESPVVARLRPLEQVTAIDLNHLYVALHGHIELQIRKEGGAAYEERVREQARVAFRAQWGMPPGPVEGRKSGP